MSQELPAATLDIESQTEEIEREEANRANLETCTVQRETVESMKERLQHNLDHATFDDWVSIKHALGTRILSFGDGTWEIEVSVPANPIVTKTPGYLLRPPHSRSQV